MPPSGVNLAVTADGEPYNKLRRPDQLLSSLDPSPTPKEATPNAPPTAGLDKRKRDDDDTQGPGRSQGAYIKRPRVPSSSKNAGKAGKSRKPMKAPGRLPVSDGECSSDDEITIQARAFLRNAR